MSQAAPAGLRNIARRQFLSGAAAAMALRPYPAKAAGPRLVSLSWAVSETLYAMGVAPVAAAETALYDSVVRQPETPASTVDIGLQGAPNLEYLAQLSPDIVIIQSWQDNLRPALERCADVETVDIYTGVGDAFAHARDAARKLGTIAAMPARADGLVLQCDARLEMLRRRLRPGANTACLLVQMIDETNLTVFTAGSLFDGALTRLGLQNAWPGPPSLLWGGAVVGLEQLAEHPDATLILIDSPGLAPDETLTGSPLWQALPPVRAGRSHRLASLWGFGGLPTALRFAEALTNAIA